MNILEGISVLVTGALIITSFPAMAEHDTLKVFARVEINFNTGWLFAPKDIAHGQSVELSEKSFESVCLPHCNKIVPHSNFDTSLYAIISWYRRHYTPPLKYQGKRFYLEFQGVSKAAKVFVNGIAVGEHKGAYTPFTLDITDKLIIGSDNVIAVQVDSRQRKDIPPEGLNVDYMIFGGIVRNVVLTVADPLHVEWAYVSRDSAFPDRAHVKVRVFNQNGERKNCMLNVDVLDSAMTVAASAESRHAVSPYSGYEFTCVTGPIADLRLWNPDHPYLYTARIRLQDGRRCADDCSKRFGMRTVAFSKTDGTFSMNGQRLKLRGLNRHETYPFIGRAAADRLQRKDADIMKYDFGCNTVRCSHYPQSPAFLDRCDEIGLLVLEEIPGWMYVSRRSDWQSIVLQNVNDMIVRDRSHPSIISFGVRINESADFHDLYVSTNRLARALDPGRPTHGVRVVNHGSEHEFLEDVWVYNYAVPAAKPAVLPWITGEHVGHRSTTHSWDGEQLLVNQMLAHAAVHDSASANPKIAGLLGWCAFDYNSPYKYEEKSVCYHGVADIFRFPKHAAWFYRSQADPAFYGPMVYIAHCWKKALAPDDIWVASNCEKVELFVNNVSMGRKAPDRYRNLPHPLFVWKSVRFRAGELKAVGFINDREAATFIRRTSEGPVRLRMTPDDTVLETGGDMTRVVVTAIDSFGQVVPQASDTVRLSAGGAGEFLGESPIALEDGKTAFFVKTRADRTGVITCRAECAKLTEANASIMVRKDFSVDR
jgi:beta-galactosidase